MQRCPNCTALHTCYPLGLERQYFQHDTVAGNFMRDVSFGGGVDDAEEAVPPGEEAASALLAAIPTEHLPRSYLQTAWELRADSGPTIALAAAAAEAAALESAETATSVDADPAGTTGWRQLSGASTVPLTEDEVFDVVITPLPTGEQEGVEEPKTDWCPRPARYKAPPSDERIAAAQGELVQEQETPPAQPPLALMAPSKGPPSFKLMPPLWATAARPKLPPAPFIIDFDR